MGLATAAKAQIVKTYKQGKNDTGSPEVQIALLSARIDYLTEHLSANKNDKHSRYGQGVLVSQRRRLLKYLKRVSMERYLKLLQALKIRG